MACERDYVRGEPRALGVDWDVGTRRLRYAGVCEVGPSAPTRVVKGMLWYDTDATGSSVSSTVNIVIKTADYTLTADDVAVLGNGTLTFTLPTAVGIAGKGYEIKNVGTGVVTVVCTGSETIELRSKVVLRRRRPAIRVRSDNANWEIM